MNLSTLNKTFWDYFKKCPRKSCLNFRKNHTMFNEKIIIYKAISPDQQRIDILEKISKKFFTQLIKNKEIDIKEIKNISLALIQKKIENIKSNDRYNKEYKKKAIDILNSMKDFEDIKILIDVLKPEDAIDLEFGGTFEMDISEYINRKYKRTSGTGIKNEYHYKLDIPFYKKNNNETTIIKFTNDSYFYDINQDITITKTFFDKSTDEKLTKIILYDLNSMKRVELENMTVNLEHLYNIFKMIDSNYTYANPGEYCNDCFYQELCKVGIKKTFKEVINEKENKEI